MAGRSSEPSAGSGEQSGTDVTQTPPRQYRAGVKAVVTAEEKVLLVRECHPDGTDFWTLPGGGLETGETSREALRREIKEELRCGCTVGGRLGTCVYEHQTRPVKTVYVLHGAELPTAPESNLSEGILDVEWRHPAQLPVNTLNPIERVLETLAGTD